LKIAYIFNEFLSQIRRAWKRRVALNLDDATTYIKKLVARRLENNIRELSNERPEVFDPQPDVLDFHQEVQQLVEGATQSHVC